MGSPLRLRDIARGDTVLTMRGVGYPLCLPQNVSNHIEPLHLWTCWHHPSVRHKSVPSAQTGRMPRLRGVQVLWFGPVALRAFPLRRPPLRPILGRALGALPGFRPGALCTSHCVTCCVLCAQRHAKQGLCPCTSQSAYVCVYVCMCALSVQCFPSLGLVCIPASLSTTLPGGGPIPHLGLTRSCFLPGLLMPSSGSRHGARHL